MPAPPPLLCLELAKVRAQLEHYEHPLLRFSAREREGAIELVIEPKDSSLGLAAYVAPVHARDLAHPQFPWTFQRYLYDCMHDYIVEMFGRTPQMRDERP